MRYRHELGERRPPQYGVVGAGMVDPLEGDSLAAVVALGTEQDVELDEPHGRAGSPWHDAVEDRPVGRQAGLGDTQLPQRVAVEDVDAAASVDEDA